MVEMARRAVRAMIGQELRARYEVPQDLPHEMLAFLVQLNERFTMVRIEALATI